MALATQDVTAVQFGTNVIDRASAQYQQLRRLVTELRELLAEQDLLELVELRDYASVLRRLADERSRG